MQDWRVGRLVRTNVLPSLFGGGTMTIPKNQQRVGLLITGGQTDNTFIPWVNVTIDTGTIFPLSFAQNSTQLWLLTTHGDFPTHGFTIVNSFANCVIGAIEFVMPENYLAAGLEQFISEQSKWRG